MKRTELKRKTPMSRGAATLDRTASPLRRTRLAQVGAKAAAALAAGIKPKAKRTKPAVGATTRKALRLRSGGACEIGLHLCIGVATDPQHRITQKDGGRHGAAKVHHDRLSNLLHACRPCHGYVTGEPFESYQNGWSCKEGTDTEREPALMCGVLVYLTDAGTVRPFRGEVAA